MALADYVAAVLDDSPAAFWQLQEASGDFEDSSGNGLTAADAGTPDYEQAGPAADVMSVCFAGNENGIHAAIAANVTDDWTLEAFALKQVVNGNDDIVFNGATTDGFTLSWNGATGKPRGVRPGVAFMADFAGTFDVDTWYALAVVRRSGTWEYYVDGDVDTANAGTGAPAAPTTQCGIGSRFNNVQQCISLAAIYDSALSAARIDAHFAALTAVASSDEGAQRYLALGMV